MSLDFKNTKEIAIPANPFDRIIGQDEAVSIAKMVATQRRHLLLVGPPGTGKSMLAQAIASVLPKPGTEIWICHNQFNAEKPIIEIKRQEQVSSEQPKQVQAGKFVSPNQIPSFVAERLGFRCVRCGATSSPTVSICPQCGATKFVRNDNRLVEQASAFMEGQKPESNRVYTVRHDLSGKDEQIIYERTPEGNIVMLTADDVRKINNQIKAGAKRPLVPLSRSLFVQVSGASETELLGDVRHDPYGGHPQIGTPNYMRVVPGAIHEAHEGVLYVDELATLGNLQKYILSAMQDKTFPIVGRNPTSSGASVRVEGVPCDFILVGSVNINDMPQIIPPLRSRIRGDGYEVLMNAFMADTPVNRKKMAQFVAQEILRDGKIPHATKDAIEEIIKEAKNLTKSIDNGNGLTLRLRNLSGIIKLAGDLAILDKSEFIEAKHVSAALKSARPIEDQIHEKYDSWWKAGAADYGAKSHKPGPETA